MAICDGACDIFVHGSLLLRFQMKFSFFMGVYVIVWWEMENPLWDWIVWASIFLLIMHIWNKLCYGDSYLYFQIFVRLFLAWKYLIYHDISAIQTFKNLSCHEWKAIDSCWKAVDLLMVLAKWASWIAYLFTFNISKYINM